MSTLQAIRGQSISHCRLLERLGVGGMGVVYQAEDLELGRFVAWKFLSDDLVSVPHAYERSYREARAASALNHPNIYTIYEIGEQQRNVFIAMEGLEGHSLRQLLRTMRWICSCRRASSQFSVLREAKNPDTRRVFKRKYVKPTISSEGEGF